MPLQATSGAASQDGFGGNGVPIVPNYIEEVFSTNLYTGTGATQTITNNIDMTKGYLLWFKTRSTTKDNKVYDSARGVNKTLVTNTTDPQVTQTFPISVSTTGFTIPDEYDINTLNDTLVAWTFRKQPKFFDVQVFNGDPSSFVTVNHNLGAVPGFIVYKRISGTPSTNPWYAWHRTFNANDIISLNTTAAKQSGVGAIDAITSTSTTFYDSSGSTSNQYVAYFFAHDAGGFGLTGTDNVISCGSYVSNGSKISVNLGWEPQWILIKKATGAANNWTIVDSMRELTANATNASAPLFPNLTNAEAASSSTDGPAPNSTGFSVPYSSSAFNYPSGETYIYIAIRRGPMKVPTVGTSVFAPVTTTNDANPITTGFPVDLAFENKQSGNTYNTIAMNRLVGNGVLFTSSTSAESTGFGNATTWFQSNTSITPYIFGATNIITYNFRRAPSFMDVVCYTGTGVARTVAHNLAAVPELMIVKRRNDVRDWNVYAAPLGATKFMYLNTYDAVQTDTMWNDTAPTSSVFTVGTYQGVNASASTYVAFLFATCAGVSKVGSYTGTATTLQIDCGFTGGARFVLIKRTNSTGGGTGDWYVWDSARGIVSGNDPYLLLNTTAAEVTGTDYIDTYSAGFEISSTAPVAINASGGAYIFLAIA
jgi:hypothetical protein